MKAQALALLLAATAGCAHTHVLPQSPSMKDEAHFNRVAHDANVTLEKADGTKSVIVGPVMGDGVIRWEPSNSQQLFSVPYADIQELSLRSTGRGLRDGFLIGSGVGLALSAIMIHGLAGNCQGTTCSLSSRLPVLLLALPPALLGAVIGASGAGERFEFMPR